MRKNLVNITSFFLLALFMTISTTACGESSGKSNGESVMAKVSAKHAEFVPFKITSFEGSLIDIAKLRGNVVVINFWASWCGPCKIEAHALEAAYRAYKDRGVHFVGIAVDDTESNARAFLKRYNISYPNAIDSDNTLSSRYQIFAIPTTFVIDKAGLIRYKRQGAVTKEGLYEEIKRLL